MKNIFNYVILYLLVISSVIKCSILGELFGKKDKEKGPSAREVTPAQVHRNRTFEEYDDDEDDTEEDDDDEDDDDEVDEEEEDEEQDLKDYNEDDDDDDSFEDY